TELAQVVDLVKQRLSKDGIQIPQGMDLSSIIDLYRERVKTVNELAQSILYFFQDFTEFNPDSVKKVFKAAALEPLQLLQQKLTALETWSAENIHQVVHVVTEELGVNMGKVGQPLRVAVTGGSFSPPIDLTVEMIGREQSLNRIARAIGEISKNQL
ncbi:MAG: glutamate--tRNA ligase, partial [Gammaproteobacteria bacterium]|nr:glutamate--tRNA ligase [Gammaproteobacteria bacterium]